MAKLAPLLALATAAALALGGCGSSGPSLPADIPQANAQGLNGYLVQAEQACKLQDGARLRDAAQLYAQAVDELPSTVDPQVVVVLRKGADNLTALAKNGEGCDIGASGATGFSGVEPTTTTPAVASTAVPTGEPKPKPEGKAKPEKAAKPAPKPEPAPSPAPKPEPKPKPEPGGDQGGGGNDQGGGNSGGVGVGPGAKPAKGGD